MIRRTQKRGDNDGRLMLAVGGLLFIPFCATGIYSLAIKLQRPQGPLEWGLRLLLWELAISGTTFFSVGLFWGISGNRRLKKLLDTVAVRFAWILIPLATIAIIGAVIIGVIG